MTAGRDEVIAEMFHDTYERLAPQFGYATRPDTRKFDPESPNGRLMIAVCKEIREALSRVGGREVELLEELFNAVDRGPRETEEVETVMNKVMHHLLAKDTKEG